MVSTELAGEAGGLLVLIRGSWIVDREDSGWMRMNSNRLRLTKLQGTRPQQHCLQRWRQPSAALNQRLQRPVSVFLDRVVQNIDCIPHRERGEIVAHGENASTSYNQEQRIEI